jgi:sugar lactone lactonase YvrE
VADSGNQAIRKITPDGTVSTFAGTGVAGADNGPIATATFSAPTGIAIDAAGNFYIADFNNKMIRKISSDGIVSTLAGGNIGRNNEIGYDNGPGATASFTAPDRLAVDAGGNVYVSDFKMIRKITPDGTVSTLAGNDNDPDGYSTAADGKGSDATFGVADGVTIDAAGNLYVGDSLNPASIRKVTPDGIVTTLAGGGTGNAADGIGKKASFGIVRGIAVNSQGNLIYAADYNTSLIRKIVIK